MPADPLLRLESLPGVPEAVVQARAAVDKLLSHRVLRRKSAEVSAESALRCARASAQLEGSAVPLEELRRLMADGLPLLPAVTGALNVSAAIGELRPTWDVAPRQVLARLHLLANGPLASSPEELEALGRPREGQVSTDPLGLGSPPPQLEVGARLTGLVEVLGRPTKASALVVAAVVHAELLALRPFGVGDGIVARAAARMVLVGRGLDPKAVTQPEVGYLEAGDYAEAAAAYVAGDPARFIVHTCQGVAWGAREGLAVAEALQRGE